MNSTALGAEKLKKENIIFISDAHEKFYYEKLKEVWYQDVYHKALCYCLGISDDTRRNVYNIYDFKTGCVKTECLHEGWQTSGSVRVVRMAFNLYCNGMPSVNDYEDTEEQIDVKSPFDGNKEVLQSVCRSEKEKCSRKLVESKGECIMCKIIAIANQKGGVGKTTTTSNLGIGLAKQGKKVLLIDADAQGSLTASLGFTEPDKLEETLATVMANIINDVEMEDGCGILKHDEGIDLMPGNIELSGLEVSLVNVMSRELVLHSYIEQVKKMYDYILIDCMPSLGMITINVFASADSILIPVQAAYLPVKGLEQLIKTIGKVKRQINPKLEIEGILLTMVDNRTNYAKDISALLIENYGKITRKDIIYFMPIVIERYITRLKMMSWLC